MSLPRFLRGFNKTKSSSSSTHLVHNQVASDLNLSDASSSSSSSGPKDALGQPLPVSTVIISSKKPPSIALTAPDLDTNEPPISSTSTSLKDPGSHDAPPSSSDLPIPSSTRSSRSSSRSSSTSSTVPIPIASNKPRSNRNHDDYDEEINGPTHPSLLSTSCPNFTFTSFSEYVPTPPIPTVHITSPRPPRPSYPLPPIPAEELSSSPTSLPLSTTIPRNRVRSNALSVLSDPQPVPGNSSNSLDGSETLSRPVKLHDQAKIESDRQGDHKEVTEDEVPPLAPRFRSLSTSTSVDSTSSRPVSILKKPRSILRSRSGSQPLPEPMARTGSGSESLIPAFPAPPTSRHSGSSDTSFASASGSWYLQHDPSEMARREEARSDVVPVPRVRRSNSHSQRRLSGRDQDVKEQDSIG
ncbi:hypothetical protein CPC16_007725 [Podila verticillata]|nr:hypothetical protein CPC16_007725 [Podila verticillata]